MKTPVATAKPATGAALAQQSPNVVMVTPQKVNARTAHISSLSKTPLTSKQTQQQANHENEQNAQEWLRSSYETGVEGNTDRVDMQELYKLYVTSMSKLKRGGVVSPAFFPKVVKLVFGAAVGPVKDQGAPFYTGIRAKKVAISVKTTTQAILPRVVVSSVR